MTSKEQEANAPRFKGVWIEAKIWDHKDLSVHEKVLWGTLNSLCDEKRDATASNDWLAERLKVKPESVKNMITHLKKIGLLIQTGFDGRIRSLSTITGHPEMRAEGILGCGQGASKDADRTPPLYVENKDEIFPLKSPSEEAAERILDHLNRIAGRSFKANKANLRGIQARLQDVDGDEQGIIQMLDRMNSLWGSDPKMSEYLQPSTLFGPVKFQERYDKRAIPVYKAADGASLNRDIEFVRNSEAFPGGVHWFTEHSKADREAYLAARARIEAIDPHFDFQGLKR